MLPVCTCHRDLTSPLMSHNNHSSSTSSNFQLIFDNALIMYKKCSAVYCNTSNFQTAKVVRADQDALFEMFKRVEAFFQRLDIQYTLKWHQIKECYSHP